MCTHIKWTPNIWNIYILLITISFVDVFVHCCRCCDRERVKNSMAEKCEQWVLLCSHLQSRRSNLCMVFFHFFSHFLLLHMFYNRIQIASGIYWHRCCCAYERVSKPCVPFSFALSTGFVRLCLCVCVRL